MYHTRLKDYDTSYNKTGMALSKGLMHISVYFIVVLSHPPPKWEGGKKNQDFEDD